MTEAEAAGSTEFAKRMTRMFNDAALALMVSVGHRTGLFDVMAAMPAATSADIASRAALDERYVREWLAAMTTGRIVEHDAAAGTFWLPAAHAAWLARAAGPDLVLAGIAKALRPGGTYLCVDISASSKLAENTDHPLGPFLYTISCMHCMTVSLAQGGMGLRTMWGEQKARQMLADAGFTSIQATHVDGDIVNTYLVASKDSSPT